MRGVRTLLLSAAALVGCTQSITVRDSGQNRPGERLDASDGPDAGFTDDAGAIAERLRIGLS